MASRRGSGHEVGGYNSRWMGAGRLQLVTPPHVKVTTKERTQPSTLVRMASQVLVATHLVALLTGVPLGSSLSSGTLSPQRTMQMELNLPAPRP